MRCSIWPIESASILCRADDRLFRPPSTTFPPDPAVDQALAAEDGIWFGADQQVIVIKVAREVAGYFKRRKLIANQVIDEELNDGGLILSTRVGHPNQVLPIVRYWIPHLRIVSPEGLQGEMEAEIRGYLER